jgi:hypothetical protein
MKGTIRPLAGLEQVLRYEPDTGNLFWLIDRPRKTKAGKKAGYVNKSGYVEIRYNEIDYRAHRIAWYLHTGEDPSNLQIDHTNNNASDNRICNLRLATSAQNAKNLRKRSGTTSKYKGVSWHKKNGKWQAQIRSDNKNIYLGYYDDPYEAHLAYCAAATALHGEFAKFE